MTRSSRARRTLVPLVVGLLGLAVVLVGAVLPAAPASAATAAVWGTYGALSGSSTAYTSTLQLGPTFPTASVRTDSRSGSVGPQTGSTVWLPSWTPPGQVYGSSQNKAYLLLRPQADTASTPSTTTYVFDHPTPLGWSLVLGDIDADAVTVSATTADGTAATSAQLGFQGAFSYCSRTPRPSGCATQTTYDVPTWDPATATLTGNAGAVDTTGASGWFSPTVPLTSLSLVFTRRAGFPVFQTWFALRTQDLTGTVAVASGTCDVTATTVDVLRTDGSVVATTHPLADGTWSVPGPAASPDWTVALSTVPDTCQVVGPVSRTVDLSVGDATADFTVRQITTAAVEGTVTDTDGQPVAGVTVTVALAGGTSRTVTTGPDGRYGLDRLDPGDWTVTATVPDGYRGATPPQRTFTVAPSSTVVVRYQDFVLVADPTVSGTVRAGEDPVPGVVVELTSGGAPLDRVVTGADGTYAFDRVPPGTYDVLVPDPPDGYRAPPAQTVTVTTADVTGQDVALTRPGLVAGLVTLDGDPLAGVGVTVSGPGGASTTLTTDAQGRYVLEGLEPGGWTITVEPPDGTTTGQTTRSVMVTEAGESFGTEDFDLTAVAATPTPTPPPTSPPVTPPPSAPPVTAPPGGTGAPSGTGDGRLPDTGTDVGPPLVLALVLLVTGGTALAVRRTLLRR
ncbi:MSCRAMM family protein [Lapillicoccus jejuensis]|uniref:alpha-amylase n=1 Tax=Lapillicoccus jejuensis TaxID=402171 RepID=A0A542E2Z5_9MICO|nr:carboxypeptidase regulatory-like domain-containing protein [Lapillicoccus jejuensis]TQJ09710.1 carboxypeptidase family protein [Lapillicoccus jejuensis]